MTVITTLLLSFLIVLFAIAAMAVGVLLGRKRIRGSCGGIGSGACELCGDGDNTGKAPDVQENK